VDRVDIVALNATSSARGLVPMRVETSYRRSLKTCQEKCVVRTKNLSARSFRPGTNPALVLLCRHPTIRTRPTSPASSWVSRSVDEPPLACALCHPPSRSRGCEGGCPQGPQPSSRFHKETFPGTNAPPARPGARMPLGLQSCLRVLRGHRGKD